MSHRTVQARESAIATLTDLPETAVTLAARRAVESVLPPPLYGHSIRTFLYGRAWARARSVAFDEEGLLVASLFHDVGLCEPYKDTRRAFQLNSSRALAELLARCGVDRPRIDRLVDAVDYHFQPVPRWRYGSAAGLLHVGAYMDAVGLRRWQIGPESQVVRHAYPPHASSRTLFGLIARSVGGPRSCIGIFLPDLFDRGSFG